MGLYDVLVVWCMFVWFLGFVCLLIVDCLVLVLLMWFNDVDLLFLLCLFLFCLLLLFVGCDCGIGVC